MNCYQCGEPIVWPDNEDAHDNREKCIRNLRAQLSEVHAAGRRLNDANEFDLVMRQKAEQVVRLLTERGHDLIVVLCMDREWNKQVDDAVVALQAVINEARKPWAPVPQTKER